MSRLFQGVEGGGDDAIHVGELEFFKGGRIDGGRVNGVEALHRGIEVVEGFLLNEAGDHRADGAERLGFFDVEDAVGLFDGSEDGLFVEWADGAEVENFDVEFVFLLEDFSGFKGQLDRAAVTDDGKVFAFAQDVGFAEGHEVFFVGHFTGLAVEQGVFEEDDGVVVANSGLHEALGVVGVGRDDDFDAGVVSCDAFGGVRVRGTDVGAAVGGAAEHDGAVDETAGHVADVSGVVENLVERDGVEAEEHQLHDGADAEHGGADAEADETGFADGRVNDALRAVFGEHAFGDFVGAVELADFFAHEDDVRIALDFLGHGGAEGFAVG